MYVCKLNLNITIKLHKIVHIIMNLQNINNCMCC